MSPAPTPSSLKRIAAIAAFGWIEARRTRLAWIVLGTAAILLMASLFARSLALIESARIQVSFLAPALRIGAVLLVTLHTIGSLLREQQDKGMELLLSVDLTRAEYLAGKLLGYMGVAAGICLFIWVPLPFVAPTGRSIAWLTSLILESWIVVAASVFCAVTLSHLTVGTVFVMSLYLLGRAMSAIVLIATASPFADAGWTHRLIEMAVKAAALGLPALDTFTRTSWLVASPPETGEILLLALQAFVFVGLLGAATAFDLYRKNF